MKPALAELGVALEAVQGILDESDGFCQLVRLSDLDLLSPPEGLDEIYLSVFLPELTTLTDELLGAIEDTGWALCVRMPHGPVVRLRPEPAG